jgi:predicted dehydrogenase
VRVVDEQVRWGVLGTGKIARILAKAVGESRDGQLVAVGSRDHGRASSFATEFGAVGHDSYEGVIDDDAVDLVYVAIHHPAHARWAIRAADAGKHVLCEKPLAVRHADAVEIVEAARRNDVFLLEAFAYRCHPQTHRMLTLLRDGAIGQVRAIDAVFGYDAGPAPTNYLMNRDLAGGSILDVGCYTTSMAHLVAAAASGEQVLPTVDVAAAGVLGPTGVDHSTAATLTFEGGVLARVACSIQANLDSCVRIVGSNGRIEVPSPWLPGLIGGDARLLLQRWGAEPETIEVTTDTDVYAVEADSVNGFIRAGARSSEVMPWEESLANMLTLDRWRSAIGLRYPGDEDA